METVEMGVEPRQGSGKGAARRLRREGNIPAVFYGPKSPTVPVMMDAKEYQTKLAKLEGSTHLIKLRSSSSELDDKVALIKDVQIDPVAGTLLHADFYEVDVTVKLQVDVPLHFVGKAAGIVAGGILQPLQREVLVECLPFDIPEYIEIDVTPLNIHDVVHVSTLPKPPGVEFIYDSDQPLVTILPPTVEEVKVEEAEVAAEVPAEGAAAEPAPTEEKEGAA